MARLLFVPRVLACLTHQDRGEVRRCLHQADLEILRAILYSNLAASAAAYGCGGPLVMGAWSHNRVLVIASRCADPEGFSWDAAKLLETLPGVWFVKAEKTKDNGYKVETVPLEDFYS